MILASLVHSSEKERDKAPDPTLRVLEAAGDFRR